MPPPLFTLQLRDATRDVHTLSDSLVNLKLGVALGDDRVWAEGLLVFHEIFGFLEAALARHADSLLGDFAAIDGLMNRTEAFEKDLEFYYGKEWRKGYEVRRSVASYLRHLKQLEDENPYLIIAYVYHLYMGLLSGGQLLRGKKNLVRRLRLQDVGGSSTPSSQPGEAVTHFGGHSIANLKKKMRETTNRAAEELDAETKESILKEGVTVFELNNEIIRSVRGVNGIFMRKCVFALLAFAGFLAVCVYMTTFLW